MSTTDSLSRLIARLHESGASYETIVGDLVKDGFSVHAIQRAYIYASEPKGFRRGMLLFFARIRQIVFPIIIIGIALFSVASILATAEEPPTIYPLYVSESNPREPRTFSYGSDPAFADTQYFLGVKRDLIQQKASFVSANLETMLLQVFKEGEQVLEVPIATKGRPGSWWETPAGIYAIEYKNEKHRSGISGVYQPWSLRFQGNFYIHGWPYHANGERVSTAYSGGCIRLEDEYAQQVYELTELGMPVIVFEREKSHEQKSFSRAQPQIGASAFLVTDLSTGFVFTERNRDEKISAQSLTKVMTALVAAEYINLDASVTVPQSALVDTERPRLEAGSKVRIYDLLFPLLRESSNEAAMVLSSMLGHERFVSIMNKKAQSLGMRSTHFVDALGASSENVTTPADLYQLMLYIEGNRSFVLNIASGKVRTSAYGTSKFVDEEDTGDTVDESTRAIRSKADEKTNGMYLVEVTVGGEKRIISVSLFQSADDAKDIDTLSRFITESYE